MHDFDGPGLRALRTDEMEDGGEWRRKSGDEDGTRPVKTSGDYTVGWLESKRVHIKIEAIEPSSPCKQLPRNLSNLLFHQAQWRCQRGMVPRYLAIGMTISLVPNQPLNAKPDTWCKVLLPCIPACSRSPVFTVLKMRNPCFLLLSGAVARSIAAAEAPRPRGVGPECSTPLPKAVKLA